jgi:hypothetical protein
MHCLSWQERMHCLSWQDPGKISWQDLSWQDLRGLSDSVVKFVFRIAGVQKTRRNGFASSLFAPAL